MIIIFLLLTFPFLLVYMIIFAPVDLFRYLYIKRRYKKTISVISNSGYIIGLGGHIGAGKSTLASGLTTYLEDYIKSLATNKMEYVQTIINNYDFTPLNNYLDDVFFDEKIDAVQEYVSQVMKDILYTEDDYCNFYNDGIKLHTYEALVKDYIEAYLALKRDNYVYSNIKFDSIVTRNRSFDLKGKDFKIKDRYLNRDYRLRRYSIFFYDEATLDSDKLNFNWMSSTKDDSGTIEHLRLFRHYFKSKSFYITTLQNPERLIKVERELFNAIYMIRNKYDFEEFKRIKKILHIVNWINDKTHTLKNKIKSLLHINIKDDKKTFYKNVKRYLTQSIDNYSARDFLVYEVDIFDTTKDAENNSRNKLRTKLVLPKKWCYAPIDTYEYSYQYDAAVATSDRSPEEKKEDYLIEDKIELANELLKKKIKVTENKKPTSTKKQEIIIR